MKDLAASSIVRHFADALGGQDEAAWLAAALACWATQEGHVCADLTQALGWGPWGERLDEAARRDFLLKLPKLAIVGDGQADTPLVWEEGRLFLRRYYEDERRIAHALIRRSSHVMPIDEGERERLDVLFPDPDQRRAAEVALSRAFAVISGGPGTGKTHTLARIIQLLHEKQPDLRLALAAPTGKAAARMQEALSLAGCKTRAGEAKTLHRLLGARADGRGFHYGADRPLPVDLVVLDEASMIDVALMRRLLDALPGKARLVLLGDRDQLAAVEAGAVFAELCAHPRLQENVVTLSRQYRFAADSALGRLAAALRRGDGEESLAILRENDQALGWQTRRDWPALVASAKAGFAPLAEALTQRMGETALFSRLAAFRVLCAHREDAGHLNAALLESDGGLPRVGTPIMVTKNEPFLGLFNGDVGLVLKQEGGLREVCFPTQEGSRRVPLARLSSWMPAWAMTVHKAQGSEFEDVMIVLPERPSPVTTRELVYTAVTRARRRCTLWCSAEVLVAALSTPTRRMSGLAARLAQA